MPNTVSRFKGSKSKSFQQMTSGKPICANIKFEYCPITKNNLGLAKDFNNPKEYSKAILLFVKMNSKEYDSICFNAFKIAKNYVYNRLTLNF